MINKVQAKGTYVFEQEVLLEKVYDLLNIFFGSKEIFRRCDVNDEEDPLHLLHRRFFERNVSRLMIEIAATLRVMDDYMRNLPSESPERKEYMEKVKHADQFSFGLFDDLNLDLRQTCNKIIHTEVFELHLVNGSEAHENDIVFQQDMGDREIHWQHYRDYIRLAGRRGKQQWFVLLNIETFVSAVVKLLG